MSIDLEWGKLDPSLADHVVQVLNKHLTHVERPSFIGPIEVTSLDFGSAPPDIELVDLRDIYRDFLEDDEDDLERGPVKVTEGGAEDEDFEWVSTSSTPFTAGFFRHNSHDYIPTVEQGSYSESLSYSSQAAPSLPRSEQQSKSQPLPSASDTPEPKPNLHPNLQPHLRINWHSNLRMSLTTSLLINYPSPMFMSLPIKLSVTGLVFDGEVVVAYEGERRRVHICILDELDPYGPATGRPKREPNLTPPELDDETPLSSIPRLSKPQPIGQRLLPSIFIESEIGQTDKHVLKNVTKVERFIQDVIRKTVEEELVFPNFHTLLLGDPP
jgi:distribution and morphology protein 12